MGYPKEAEWSKFEEELLPISDSSDSSSATRNFDQFYVIARYCYDDDDQAGYRLYSIDLNSSSSSSLNPIFSWDFDEHEAFAIVGHELFMFSENHKPFFYKVQVEDKYRHHPFGFESLPEILTKIPTTHRRQNNIVSIIDITKLLDSFTPPATSIRANGPPMSGSKLSPAAVVIGDKICVFGREIYGERAYFQNTPPSFEILDTNNRSWSPLPEPPLKYHDFVTVYVASYAVHHRSCLIIQIEGQGIFGINIDCPEPHWVCLDNSDPIRDFPLIGSWTMVGKMLCSPSRVISRGYLHEHVTIALKGPRGRQRVSTQYLKVALCFDDRYINLCIVRVGLPLHPNITNLLVDIVKLDDDAFRSDLSKWNEIQSHKSFTFTLTHPCPCITFELIGCFPIKLIGEVPKGGEREVMGTRIQSTYNKGSLHTIHAGNLGRTLTSQALTDAFADQPGFLSTKVMYKRDTGRCRGFGFVTFETAETAEAALQSMNGVEVEGRPLILNRVPSKCCEDNLESTGFFSGIGS